jgi:MFS family permease
MQHDGLQLVSAAEPSGVMSPGLRALTVGLVLTVTLVAFEALAVATAMPAAEDDLGDVYLYGWVFSAFLLASLVGIAFAGERSDSGGPAFPYLAGLVLFGAGLVIGGLAPSMPVLVAGRAIQGLGAGAIPAVSYVVIGRAYPDRLRARMFALYATAWVLPGLVGPSIAGVLAEYASWRLVFLAIVPLIALAAMLTVPALRALGPPPNATRSPRRTQVPVSALLAVGAGLVLTGLTTADTFFGVPLVVAGIAIAWRPFRRLMPPGTFSARRGLPAAVAGIGALNFVFFGADSFIPLMLTDVRDQSTVVAGLVLTAATLTWTAGTWVMERLGERLGRARLIAAGFAFLGLGIALVVPVVSNAPVALAVAAWAIAGFGMGMAYPGLSLAALDATPPGAEGASGTSVKLAEFLATAMAAGLAGAIVGIGESHGWLAESLRLNFGLMVLACIPGLYAVSRLTRGRIETPTGGGTDALTGEPATAAF